MVVAVASMCRSNESGPRGPLLERDRTMASILQAIELSASFLAHFAQVSEVEVQKTEFAQVQILYQASRIYLGWKALKLVA